MIKNPNVTSRIEDHPMLSIKVMPLSATNSPSRHASCPSFCKNTWSARQLTMGSTMHLDDTASPPSSAAFMTYEQLSGCSGMSMMDLTELVGYSALVPVKSYAAQADAADQDHWVFSAQCLKPLRAACKLRNDFDLDLFTVAILLGRFQRIDELEQRLSSTQRRLHQITQRSTDALADCAPDDGSQLPLFRNDQRRYQHG
jgi:chaperone modulatory protein CbpM